MEVEGKGKENPKHYTEAPQRTHRAPTEDSQSIHRDFTEDS